MDRLTAISTFVKVVDAGGFSAAAVQLRISPAVVSTRVQSLERGLGVRLLNRTTRSLALTEIGRTYYERCVALLCDMEDAEQAARSADSAVCGRVRLNISVALEHDVPRLICQYARRHPGLVFETTATAHMPDLVGRGFDLAVRTGPLRDSSMTVRRLGAARLTLCAAPEYFQVHQRPQHVEELVDHTCLSCLDVSAKEEWTFNRSGKTHRVGISGWFCANNIESLKAVAIAGRGIALLPERSVMGDLLASRLVRLLPDFEPVGGDIHAIIPSGRQASANVRRFVDFLCEELHREARAAQPVNDDANIAALSRMAAVKPGDAATHRVKGTTWARKGHSIGSVAGRETEAQIQTRTRTARLESAT